MALNMNFGQYYRADSPIHKLDPRVKICCSLALIVCAFLITTPAQLLFAVGGVAALLLASKVPARKVLNSVRPIVMLLLVLSIFNLLWTQTGPELISLGLLRITLDGLWSAILYTVRLVLAVLLGALILLTTTPTGLTDALDSLFSPLSRIGLPGHEIAMVVALTLRFVPIMAEETSQIMDAQTARAGGISEGSMKKRVASIGPILIALFAGAMRHANNLSRALDARCYEGGSGRTKLHPLKMARSEGFATLICVLALAIIVFLGRLP